MNQSDRDIESTCDRLHSLREQTHDGRRKRKRRTISLMLVVGVLCGTALFFFYREAALFATLMGAFVGFVISRVLIFSLPSERTLNRLVCEMERTQDDIVRLTGEFNRQQKQAPFTTSATKLQESQHPPEEKDTAMNISKCTGTISPKEDRPLCETCHEPIDRDIIAQENPYGSPKIIEIWPLFCEVCETWHHSKCAPLSEGKYELPICPTCHGHLERPSFYCEVCKKGVGAQHGSKWPDYKCSHCGNTLLLTHMTEVGGREMIILFLIGLVSAGIFIWAEVAKAPLYAWRIAAVFGVVFALPFWGAIAAGVLMDMELSFVVPFKEYNNGICEAIPLSQARIFKTKPILKRFLLTYTNVLVNALRGIVGIVILFTIIYFTIN